MARVELKKITKSFVPGRAVLNDFSLTIESGELFFLLGPSGCGKSTLLRILAGLMAPDSGDIYFDGRNINRLPPEERQAAMVFQSYALWPHLNVFENIAFGLRIRGVRGRALKMAVESALASVRLSECVERKVQSLSGGQQQRVALARALAVSPAILLLDEPLSNLDAGLRDTMRSEIADICRERRQTVLYVTHDRQEALSMADRMAILKDGRISQMGTPADLYHRPENPFCARFLGDVNLLPGTVCNGCWRCQLGSFPVDLPDGGRVMALRPERIAIVAPDAADGFDAEIVSRMFAGDRMIWRCRAGETELQVCEYAPQIRPATGVLRLQINPQYLIPMGEGAEICCSDY